MDRRRIPTRSNAQPRLVDPLVRARHVEAASLEQAAGKGPSYEVQLDPPPGVEVHRLTVAGSYRTPVPILFDYGTRTAYPIRSDG